MKERNFGIDLLRVVSMMMVLSLHLMMRSFILLPTNSHNYYLAYVLESFCRPAVNC